MEKVRPFITGFVAKGKAIDELLLEELVQMQEKLMWNYGQKRKGISMGMYRAESLSYPLSYELCDPAVTKFVPLGETQEFTLLQVLKELPKGKEFASILAPFKEHPIFKDAKGEILSYPPILNSQKLGAVQVGDSEIFVELTGISLDSLWLATAVVACDLFDLGFTIEPVRVEYTGGMSYTTPLTFQQERSFTLGALNRMVGEEFNQEITTKALERMGILNLKWSSDGTGWMVPPPYRNDFLHAVDIMEDVVIGYGLGNLAPSGDRDYSPGSLTAAEGITRRVRNLMVGLGFQEMLYNYLGSKIDFIQRMGLEEKDFILVSNPMTENYEVVRGSILPNLLKSEAVSAHAVYPHAIFEVGKTVCRSLSDPSGCETLNQMAWLFAGEEASFSHVYAQLSAFFYYFNLEWQLVEKEDPRFLSGRCALVEIKGQSIGIMGEVHPQVLTNFGITVPCTAVELNLDQLLFQT
jgi:phenylalanyl-tRNA synthetase beta chain